MTPTPSLATKLTPWLSMAILCIVAFVAVRSCMSSTQVLHDTERITSIEHDTVQHSTDGQGRDHGEVRLAEADAARLQAVFPFMDSVLRSVNALRKDVQAVSALSVTSGNTIRPHVEQIPRGEKSIQHISYKDKWIDLEGIISDTPMIKYSTFDSLLVTTYSKRSWWLGKKETYLNAYSLNPSSRIGGLTGLKVNTEQPKRFGIGPYVGFGYDGKRWSPSVGVSLQYSFFKF